MANKTNKSKRKNKTRVGNKSTQRNKFDFDNEIVIGVNVNNSQPEKDKIKINTKPNKKKVNKTKNKKVKNNRKKTKKKFNHKLFLKITLLIILISGIMFFLFTTPVFNITEIEISGNEKVSKEKIESLSQISLNINTFRYSKIKIRKNIKEEPYVDSVIVNRRLPNKIKITVEERKPSYIISYNENYIYIDNQGYILEISNEAIDVPIIEGIKTKQEELIPGKRIIDEDLESINNILKIMESATSNGIDSKITAINFENNDNYLLKMDNEDKIVNFGDISNINDKILMLKEILIKEQGNKGEIFLKDINKVYFRSEV